MRIRMGQGPMGLQQPMGLQRPMGLQGLIGLQGPMLHQEPMGTQKSILNLGTKKASEGPLGFRGPLQFRESKG